MAEGAPAPTQAGLNDLPDECLLSVFRYIPIGEVAESVSRVCRRWRQLSRDDILWRRVDLELEMETRVVVALAPALEKLSIDLRWISGRNEDYVNSIPKRVKRLDIYISDGDISAAWRLLDRVQPYLRELKVRASRHTEWQDTDPLDLKRFCEAFSRCANLQLFYTDDMVLSHLGTDDQLYFTSPSATMIELVVAAQGGSGRIAQLLCPLIRAHAATLSFIELNGMPVAEEMPILAAEMAKCRVLRQVKLRYCPGISELKASTTLRSLTLIEHWQGTYDFAEAAELINSPNVRETLAFLYMYGNILCDMRQVRPVELQSLVYACTRFHPGFIEGLQGLSTIEDLRLEHVANFTDETLEQVLNVLPNLKKIKVISHRNLCRYKCFKMSLEFYRKKYEDLEIIFPYGCACSSSTSPTA